MPLPDFSPFTLIAIEAALNAATILERGFGTDYEISTKPGRQNFVTEYDRASEASIIAMIKDHYPSHHILAEESGLNKGSTKEDIIWIIDPLDGTTNFAHQIPIFTISIAAYEKDQPLCGVVYQPMTQELFIAEKGKGAFLNENRVQISQTKKIEDALLITSLPYENSFRPIFAIEKLATLSQQGTVLRNFGSAALALAYVAAGKVDAFWMYNLYPWDIAAGQLLVEEAGGICTKYVSSSWLEKPTNVLASNSFLHKTLQNLIV